MLSAISFDVPSPKGDTAEIYRVLKETFGESFHLGWCQGRLNCGELEKNPGGQIYNFSLVLVPSERVQEFKDRILDLGGEINSEESADGYVASIILRYAAKFPIGLSQNKLIARTLKQEKLNLETGRYKYVEGIVTTLIAERRLTKITQVDGTLVSVSSEEEAWAENEIFRFHNQLLANIRKHQPEIDKLLEEIRSHWGEEDMIYRFYHHSFKVYAVQAMTEKIVALLRSIDPRPGKPSLNGYFEQILVEGTGKAWDRSHNPEWLRHTRPMLEAFYHASKFLEHMDEYGEELEEAPSMLPSGWGHVLYLYDLR